MKTNTSLIFRGGALALLVVTLAGCGDDTINRQRMARFDQPEVAPISVQPSSLAVNLLAARNGQGLSPESLKVLNKMLRDQGRLNKQTLTITPWTARGQQLAQRLSSALVEAGADKNRLRVLSLSSSAGRSGDLQVQSQALAVKTPDCGINNPDQLMVKPYEAMGYFGCATQSNLAQMVADPRDLIQARTLDDADGVHAVNSIERYQKDETKDLLDINFEED